MSEDRKKPLGIDWEYERRRLIKAKIYGVYKVEDDFPQTPPPSAPPSFRKRILVRRQESPEQTQAYIEIVKYLVRQKLFGKCNYCSQRHALTYDHIYPTSKGGCKCKANVQVLCKQCNGRKGDAVFQDAHGRAFGHTQQDCPFKRKKNHE